MSRGPLWVRRVASWPVKRRRTSSGGQLREHRLAAAREIRGQPHADVEGEAERPRAVADGDVERLVAREHRQHDRLFGRARAGAPERVEFLRHVGAGHERLGQAHDARADQERSVALPAQVAERDQGRAQAVNAALGQRELAREARQGHRARGRAPGDRAASAPARPRARAAPRARAPGRKARRSGPRRRTCGEVEGRPEIGERSRR